MTINAQIRWIEGYQIAARADSGPAVVMDSTDGGAGATPMQLVLFGIAGCTAMDIVSILKKRRSPIVDLKVNIVGDQAEEYPKRFTRIQMEYVVTGQGVKRQDVERAIELSLNKYCSASASVNAELTYTYRIVEKSVKA